MSDTQSPKGEDNKQPENGKDNQNRRKPSPDDKFDWKKASRNLLIWVSIIAIVWMISRQFNSTEPNEKQLTFTQFQEYLQENKIESAEIIEREFHGRTKDDGSGAGSFVAILPYIDQKMVSTWDSLGFDYQFKEKTSNWLTYLLANILPWVLIMGIWFYFIRRMQGGGSKGVFSFGKSKAKVLTEHKPRVTFADVAGCDEAKEELTEIIAFLKEPKKFTRLGGHIPKGGLLLGPPGTGKTLLARAIAGEAGVPFFSMSGADFVEMFVGVGAARVRDLFEQGKRNAPCIIFIDEIDAVGRHRGAGLGGGHDEREQTLNQLLVEMDGFESNDGVILIAATNRPDVLDPALTRPGRFDRQIVVDRPDVRGREGIFKVHTREVPLGADVNLETLAKGTPGLAGADIANLVNEAALLAARRNANKVFMLDFENAKDKVMMGTERRSLVISRDERRQTAFHEAGHVLVAKQTPGSDPVHKVTIIPRGRALGLTHYLPIDEKHNYSRTYLNRILVQFMGGRAAEKMMFNELSTGAGNDIERATEIARKMVTEWGMSDRLGPVAWGRKHEEVFLGRDFVQHRDYSEKTSQDIDDEVKRIVHTAEQQAEKLLREHRDKLERIAEALLEREILDGEEIDILIRDGKLPPQVQPAKAALQQSVSRNPVKKKPELAKSETPQRQENQLKQPPERKEPTERKEPSERKEASEPRTPGHSRREFAKAFGVVSSRDGQRPRRPERAPRKDQTPPEAKPAQPAQNQPKPQQPAPAQRDPNLRVPQPAAKPQTQKQGLQGAQTPPVTTGQSPLRDARQPREQQQPARDTSPVPNTLLPIRDVTEHSPSQPDKSQPWNTDAAPLPPTTAADSAEKPSRRQRGVQGKRPRGIVLKVPTVESISQAEPTVAEHPEVKMDIIQPPATLPLLEERKTVVIVPEPMQAQPPTVTVATEKSVQPPERVVTPPELLVTHQDTITINQQIPKPFEPRSPAPADRLDTKPSVPASETREEVTVTFRDTTGLFTIGTPKPRIQVAPELPVKEATVTLPEQTSATSAVEQTPVADESDVGVHLPRQRLQPRRPSTPHRHKADVPTEPEKTEPSTDRQEEKPVPTETDDAV